MIQVVVEPVVTELVDVGGAVTDFGKTYWYAVGAKEATATVNRTAAIALRLIGGPRFVR